MESPPRSIINEPEIFVYIKNFGTQPGDLGVVAEQNGQVIGAAWTRIALAFGHIDSETPELAISVLPRLRGILKIFLMKVNWLESQLLQNLQQFKIKETDRLEELWSIIILMLLSPLATV